MGNGVAQHLQRYSGKNYFEMYAPFDSQRGVLNKWVITQATGPAPERVVAVCDSGCPELSGLCPTGTQTCGIWPTGWSKAMVWTRIGDGQNQTLPAHGGCCKKKTAVCDQCSSEMCSELTTWKAMLGYEDDKCSPKPHGPATPFQKECCTSVRDVMTRYPKCVCDYSKKAHGCAHASDDEDRSAVV